MSVILMPDGMPSRREPDSSPAQNLPIQVLLGTLWMFGMICASLVVFPGLRLAEEHPLAFNSWLGVGLLFWLTLYALAGLICALGACFAGLAVAQDLGFTIERKLSIGDLVPTIFRIFGF